MTTEEILAYDKKHVWHPYASMKNPLHVYKVDSADGVYLNLADGRRVIDGMSSWWAVVHGYNNPTINSAVKEQLAKMSHVMFGGLTHEGAVRLAERLIGMTPAKLQKVFFSDSGSVAVEVAMKMALQYWRAKGVTGKTKFATVRGGYHGDTWHAMSVCDPVGGMHAMYSEGLPKNYFAARPEIPFGGRWDDSEFDSMREVFKKYSGEIAAVILEPIVQGAGGMRFYHPQYLRELRNLCDRHSALLIFDEIATGFGRSGKMFATEWAEADPDIMCLGKALTGGYMSFAATLATDEIAEGVSEGEPGLFMHGPTFMANPLACAAANASLDLLESGVPLKRIAQIESALRSGLEPLRGLPKVADVRVLGAIGVVEMKEPVDMAKMQEKLLANGVWLRPFGKLLYTMPPYITSDSELERLTKAMAAAVI